MQNEDEKMIKERMRHVLSFKRMSVTKFAGNIESVRVKYTHQINGTAAIPYATILRMLRMFPDLSAEWLVLGEGTMLKQNTPTHHITQNEVHNSSAGGNINVGTTTIESSMQRLLEEKDARIAELEKDKIMLQNLLTALTASPKK